MKQTHLTGQAKLETNSNDPGEICYAFHQASQSTKSKTMW